ncbi:FG-GAP repeat protein [Pendulispora rubella]|uniref:FG-GAP repeat protein n=1 Tax=Pendulispora rubella TaxID=2741070 RepID=A0ABZ2L9M2_9BACT
MNTTLGFRKMTFVHRAALGGIALAMAACSGVDRSEPTEGHRATSLVLASQQATLSASDASMQDLFGLQVAIDGDTAAVLGQTNNGGSSPDPGLAVYVFTRTGTGWVEQQKLTPSERVTQNDFGQIAIDGDTIAMGSHHGVYIFARSGSTWGEQQKLAPRAEDSTFGASVALDGDTLVAGAPTEDAAESRAGAAYVFTRSGTSWSEQQRIVAADGQIRDLFGFAVAVDGDRIAVGADAASERGFYTGAAYVFARSATGWTQQQKLLPDAVTGGDEFGGRLALKGGTLVIGSPGDDTKGEDTGALYVFTESNATWVEQTKLFSSEAVPSQILGASVAIDGSTIVAGTKVITENGGVAYTFERSTDGQWTQHEKLAPSDPEKVYLFGYCVAVSGSTKLVGALVRDPSGHGAAYVFGPS